ncbi:aldo/keto reductase [Paenibacillus sp. 598K]|uniref:aldo/keto reductase n=1 Tax=Paenibacillus sp. 598K TaxID=1117987 RepID=UPI000FFEC084|nr:aldo/keto reductase [Paenibacillus sp. 598K]
MRPFIKASNGVDIPQLGFGVYKIKPGKNGAFEQTIRAAIEAGYRHFDTARIYGNEEALGRAIANSGIPREDFFITSKAWTTDLGYEQTQRAFEHTCKKMNTSYLDMYLLHFAGPHYVKAWKALELLYAQGKIKVIGVANFEIEHFEHLKTHATILPIINQVETHPFFQQQSLREYMIRHQILHEAWGPLGQGNASLFNNEELKAIAERHNKTVGQVILRWHINRQTIVIPKSSSPLRIRENIQALDFTLSDADMMRIAKLDTGKRYAVHPTGYQVNPLYVKLSKIFLKA